ncbi:NAD-dependent oxidoreductase [Bifidobacterium cuniculi]|uniref:NAD-dependent oxidoreductase n=1 Tax=Bifidobacterium cuniculi TaxID=1688 RepID=A0A087AYN8_9BIFI|nr:Gfo/Idh/MocA family oxidoreductase [Bifidobacterium cuniculi]KFI63888.1 NAD-dependent oxidoreductase [Bifidobacterium cuniculi]
MTMNDRASTAVHAATADDTQGATAQTAPSAPNPTPTLPPLKVAILGAGRIAVSMARTLTMMAADDRYRTLVDPYAVASRDQARADAFAKEHGLPKAYGSYEAMLADPEVDLVYIATPHSLHAKQAIACMRAGKHVLVEKAFALNVEQARAMIDVSEDTGRFCGEAIWTRFMPSRLLVDEALSAGEIGDVTAVHANLCYPMTHKARLKDPRLGGGALLDVGVYPLNFIDMVLGERELRRLDTTMVTFPTGVDAQNSTTLVYANDTMATAYSSMMNASDRDGRVDGTEGYLVCRNINDIEGIDIYGTDHELKRHVDVPAQLTGYEYEVKAAVRAIRAGRRDCPEMTHADTLRMMALMDRIRREWGLHYPTEDDAVDGTADAD